MSDAQETQLAAKQDLIVSDSQETQPAAKQKPEITPVPFLPIWRTIVLSVGCFFSICGTALGFDSLVSILRGTAEPGSVAAMLFFYGIGIVCAFACQAQLKERHAIKELNQEQKVLSYAKAEKGRGLTISEVSLNCSLNVSDSMQICNRLVSRNICQVEVSENGEMLYVFPCFSKQIELK